MLLANPSSAVFLDVGVRARALNLAQWFAASAFRQVAFSGTRKMMLVVFNADPPRFPEAHPAHQRHNVSFPAQSLLLSFLSPDVHTIICRGAGSSARSSSSSYVSASQALTPPTSGVCQPLVSGTPCPPAAPRPQQQSQAVSAGRQPDQQHSAQQQPKQIQPAVSLQFLGSSPLLPSFAFCLVFSSSPINFIRSSRLYLSVHCFLQTRVLFWWSPQ